MQKSYTTDGGTMSNERSEEDPDFVILAALLGLPACCTSPKTQDLSRWFVNRTPDAGGTAGPCVFLSVEPPHILT